MEEQLDRNPTYFILKKFSIGLILSIFFVFFYLLLSRTSFSFELISTAFFIFGGIFFIMGGLRDFFDSIFFKKIRGRNIQQSIDENYLYGFGIAGEDILVGFLLILTSLISSAIRL